MKPMIEIYPYNPQWPSFFEKEAALIRQALGANCTDIHHVGSTAIEEMCAKPIIDMIPVVKDIMKVDDAQAAMVKLGYEVKGEHGMLFRRFFTKSRENISFNLHVYEKDAGELDRLVKFRDWLRQHPQDASDYAHLKQELAAKFSNESLRYTMGKEYLIANIDSKTGYSGYRIVKVLTDREWEAYHRIRRAQIFDLLDVKYDYNHETLKNNAHVHLVLYSGSAIVGVAQLEYLDSKNVALRPFAIDGVYQNQGLGSIFLVNIERWLKQQGCEVLRFHAYFKAVKFYEQLGYTCMPFHEENRSIDVECIDMGKRLF